MKRLAIRPRRCVWCGHILWLYQDKSPGKTLHLDCWRYVEAITAETQSQYEVHEQEEKLLVIRPDDYAAFLGRLKDEDGD